MSVTKRLAIAAGIMGMAVGAWVLAQQTSAPPAGQPSPAAPPKQERKLPPPPARDVVGARVNGQIIPELAVYRILAQNPSESRQEAMDFLIDNAIVDQYLFALKIAVEPQEIDARVKEMKDEAEKDGKGGWEKLLQSMFLTEEDLRLQLGAVLRWDRFADKHATDKNLHELFDKQRAIFDGSQVHARHILLKGDVENTKARLLALRKEIEDYAAGEAAKLGTGAAKLDQEKARIEALVKKFAEKAAEVSECPSKKDGGDLDWFPRSGAMVEPFARAAFALKPFEMSDPVATEFGFHLILSVDYKAGKEVQYDAVKSVVKEVYCDRLRDAVLNAMRPRAQIVIEPAPK
jgi:peptidyl-prolyl cis-trans isomerase C